jgi:hypothetical protein
MGSSCTAYGARCGASEHQTGVLRRSAHVIMYRER